MSEQKLCYGCMEPLDGSTVCPHCGYSQDAAILACQLKPGTVLRERYLIGKALESNGEGITYLAFDQTVGCKVLVREYMPEQICSRVQDSTLINVEREHLAQYKALMAEYTELNKALARLRSLSHLNPALDLISENNTTYAVYEYLEGRTLLEYLKENAGELSWTTVKRIFPPFFTSLSLLHNAGVLHRGISPETIYVTDKGELKLCGFCISSVRTKDTELASELFDGYAAPEQYYADRRQGTWTDVYGICSVLYRILTGCRATDANTRQDYDDLIPPAEVNPHVPENVSAAIMKGLTLDYEKRIQNVTDLVTQLFEDAPAESEERTDATMPFRVPDVQTKQPAADSERRIEHVAQPHQPRQQQSRPKQQEPSVLERVRAPLLIAFLFIAIVTLVVLAFMQIWSAQNGNSTAAGSSGWSSVQDNVVTAQTAETTRGPVSDAVMPELVGMNYPIKRDEMAGFLEMDVEYVFSETEPKDQIVWQELEPGTPFMSGSTVKVQVSRGTSLKVLPDYHGYKLQTYLDKLEELGFVKGIDGGATSKKAEGNKNKKDSSAAETTTTTTTTNANGAKQSVIYKATVNYKFANGNVCSVEPKVGTQIDVLKDYEIIVYYANNPVVTTASTSRTNTTSGTTSVSGATASTTEGNAGTTQPPASTTQAPPATTAAPPATSATVATTAAAGGED